MERIPQPIMDKRGEPHMKRFEDQRWLLDNIIRANGVDWDQPRSIYISAPCGMEGQADIAGVRERVKKMGDIAPAFEAVARRRELGVRLALGANPWQVFSLVIGQGLRLAVVGVAIGLGVAVVATRLLRGMLFNTSATDPLIYASLALLLLTMAGVACYVPARRAMRVDPMRALRSE